MSREARAQADIKFTYVVSCQIYGQQKQRKSPEATDIALLLQRCAFLVGFFLEFHLNTAMQVSWLCAFFLSVLDYMVRQFSVSRILLLPHL